MVYRLLSWVAVDGKFDDMLTGKRSPLISYALKTMGNLHSFWECHYHIEVKCKCLATVYIVPYCGTIVPIESPHVSYVYE